MKLLRGIHFGLQVTGVIVGSLAQVVRAEWQRRRRTRGAR